MTSNDDRIESDARARWATHEFNGVLEAAQSGAEWAWRQLVETYSPSLLGYARVRGAPDPEDVLSEVWFAVATGITDFEGDEPGFRSWLFVIAHRRSIDAGRKEARQPRPTEPASLEGLNRRSTTSAESIALDVVSSEELDNLLAGLTTEQRAVIALRIVADLSLKETATVMDKNVGAVKALQHRALEALRQEIAKGAYPNEDL